MKLNVEIDRKKIRAVYDSGSNTTLINHNVIKTIKSKISEHKCLFKTLGGINFTESRAKLQMKINNIEKEFDVYVVRNSNFSYDLLLGLDAIKKFGLIQDENLEIYQRLENGKVGSVVRIT